jgi:hypothetical protein
MTSNCHGISTPPLPTLHPQPPYRISYPITMTFRNFRRVRHVERLLLFAISMNLVYFSCVIPVFPPVTSSLHVEALLHLLLVLSYGRLVNSTKSLLPADAILLT